MSAVVAARRGRPSAIGAVFEHRLLAYRKTFRASLFSSFVGPVLYLTAMGLGLGQYVQGGSGTLGGVPYIVFLAPGLLVATAMQSGTFEATFPVMNGLVWDRIYHAMYATPIGGRDIALGNLLWIAARLTLITTVFTAVVFLFGAADSVLFVLAIPVAVLTGLSFSGPVAAFAATQRNTERFNMLFRFGIVPLFLFSGTFFPIEQLPLPLQAVAWLTPLYHGVALARGLSLGLIGDAPLLALAHLAFLVVFASVGAVLAARSISTRLVRG